jgi:hypothetical protein
VQPTDHRVRSVFVFSPQNTEAGRRNERVSGRRPQGLVGRDLEGIGSMKDRLVRVFVAVGALAATALAGGASLKGF